MLCAGHQKALFDVLCRLRCNKNEQDLYINRYDSFMACLMWVRLLYITASLATWVECETIFLWLWSFCAVGRRFVPGPWHYSRGNFSSSQSFLGNIWQLSQLNNIRSRTIVNLWSYFSSDITSYWPFPSCNIDLSCLLLF